MRNFKSLMMATSLFTPLVLFLQFLAITSHARTLSENPPNAFSLQTDESEIPKSLSPPLPASGDITPESSSRNRLMWVTQIKRPPKSPPPPGPVPSTRPPSPAECFCSWFPRFCCWFTPTTSTSPCYGKSSVAHQKSSDFSTHYYAFSSRMDSLEATCFTTITTNDE